MRLTLTESGEAKIREAWGAFGESVLEEAGVSSRFEVSLEDVLIVAIRRLIPPEQLEPIASPVEIQDPPKRECEHPENWLVRHPDPSRLLYGCRMCGAELSAAEIIARPKR